MATNCTRCEGTGFLNIEQAPEDVADGGVEAVQKWLAEVAAERVSLGRCGCQNNPQGVPCPYCELDHDVQVCDCCGNGTDAWHGTPGSHYTQDDPSGSLGPYAYNGGLCECH